MEYRTEKTKPGLIVLAHSVTWCAAIKCHFSDYKLHWVLSIDGLVEELGRNRTIAAMIEIETSKIEPICQQLQPLTNNPQNLKLFAVGDHGLLPWLPLLQASGISSCHWSLLQIPLLSQRVKMHARSTPAKRSSIEKSVFACLPWPTAATDNQA